MAFVGRIRVLERYIFHKEIRNFSRDMASVVKIRVLSRDIWLP
mgnify:CR=1 FL=1